MSARLDDGKGIGNEEAAGAPVLVLGASGYVGARLVPRLLEKGYRVRATSRSIEKLKGKLWAQAPGVELVETDVMDEASLVRAMSGCRQAYYLVHSMNAQSRNFAEADRLAASTVVEVAERCGLEQIIYLGGLGDDSPDLSKHLRSRAEVDQILQAGRVPVTTLRAAMIIGSGSASFEILRYLVERLPAMITPKWVSIPTQPIAIANALHYLVEALAHPEMKGGSFDIGGDEVLTYKELMKLYQEESGLPARLILPIPFFTPRLSSYWIHLVTPVPAYIARPLAEGLRNPTVCRDEAIRKLIPQRLYGCREAIRRALDRTQHHQVESHWTDAGRVWPVEWSSSDDPLWAGGTVYEDCRAVVINAPKEKVWEPIIKLGGSTGYYYGNWMWRLRGVMDKLFGGVGLRRGRRDPNEVHPGDALDFWRVKEATRASRLSLVAEMKLPGDAVLEFDLEELDGGRTLLTQTARFLPSGLLGLVYWFAVTPLHNLVFDGMLRGIALSAGEPGAAPGGLIVDGPFKVKKSSPSRPRRPAVRRGRRSTVH